LHCHLQRRKKKFLLGRWREHVRAYINRHLKPATVLAVISEKGREENRDSKKTKRSYPLVAERNKTSPRGEKEREFPSAWGKDVAFHARRGLTASSCEGKGNDGTVLLASFSSPQLQYFRKCADRRSFMRDM